MATLKKEFWALRRNRVGLISLVALIFIGWLIAHYMKASPPATDPVSPLLHKDGRLIVPENSPLRRLISVQTLSLQKIAVPYTLPAVVEADPATMVTVFPPLLGRINSLEKRLGDSVKEGDILFTIASPDLAQAISDMEKAQAAVTFAKQNLSRQEKLITSDIAARFDLEQAQNTYAQALSESERSNARLAILKVKSTDITDKHVLVVRSPVNGTVVSLNAAVGEYWNDATSSIMTLADLSHVFITAKAQEKDLVHLYIGQTANVQLDVYPHLLQTTVFNIAAVLDADTRTVPVRMLFTNPGGQLKPNMFGKGTFLGQLHDAIVLPLSAVIQRGFESVVFVEVAPWQFEPRKLQINSQFDDKVEVLAGLQVNERVVVRGGIILND